MLRRCTNILSTTTAAASSFLSTLAATDNIHFSSLVFRGAAVDEDVLEFDEDDKLAAISDESNFSIIFSSSSSAPFHVDPHQHFLEKLPPPRFLLRFAAFRVMLMSPEERDEQKPSLALQAAQEFDLFRTESPRLRIRDEVLAKLMLETLVNHQQHQQKEEPTGANLLRVFCVAASLLGMDHRAAEIQCLWENDNHNNKARFVHDELVPAAQRILLERFKSLDKQQQQHETVPQESHQVAESSSTHTNGTNDIASISAVVDSFFSKEKQQQQPPESVVSLHFSRDTLRAAAALTPTLPLPQAIDVFAAYAVAASQLYSEQPVLPFEFIGEVNSVAYVLTARLAQQDEQNAATKSCQEEDRSSLRLLVALERCALAATYLQLNEHRDLWNAIVDRAEIELSSGTNNNNRSNITKTLSAAERRAATGLLFALKRRYESVKLRSEQLAAAAVATTTNAARPSLVTTPETQELLDEIEQQFEDLEVAVKEFLCLQQV